MSLPDPLDLERLCRSLAFLDRVLEPDQPDLRYFSYEPRFGAGGALAAMHTGEGDQYAIWFAKGGVVIAGFDPRSPYAKVAAKDRAHSLYQGLPKTLQQARVEFDDVTFVYHRLKTAQQWSSSPPLARRGDYDGSQGLLWLLDGDPKKYVRHARDYFGRQVAVRDVEQVFAGRIDAELLTRLNHEVLARGALATAKKLGLRVDRSKQPARASSVLSAAKKQLTALLDPVDLAQRLKTFALIDAIVAPKSRTVFAEIHGTVTIGRLRRKAAGAVLHLWLAVPKGVIHGGEAAGSAGLEAVPPALVKRWRESSEFTGETALFAHNQGEDWVLSRWDPSVAKALTIFLPNYLKWAREHYGRPLSTSAITALWKHEPLTPRLAQELNPRANWLGVQRAAVALKWRIRA